MNLIGISGKKLSGKDTVGNIIKMEFPKYNWQIKKFAYKVKEVASLLTGIPVEDFEDQEIKGGVLGEEWSYWYCNGKKFFTEKEAKEESDVLYSMEGWDAPVECKQLNVRQLLQEIGTEAIRDNIHPNAWVNALFSDYKPINNCQQHADGLFYTDECGENEVPPVYPNWIITDVRFPNEAKAIKDRGGILIRVNRSGYISDLPKNSTPLEHLARGKELHISETSLDSYKDWDYVIDNNGTIIELMFKVKRTLKNIL